MEGREQAFVAAQCDHCHREFNLLSGGICARCKQLLCGWHLHGLSGLLLGWRPWGEREPICTACRRAAAG